MARPTVTNDGLVVRARQGYCIVSYDGNQPGVPTHLRAGFNLQGRQFDTGERMEIPATAAFCLKRDAHPSAKVTIYDGEPVKWEAIRAIHRAQQQRTMDFTDAFSPPDVG